MNTNRTADRARLHGVLAIGRVVFNELFDGDSALVTGRGRRFVGYRRFVEHARLSISAKRVWEAVRLCVLHDTLREEARDALSFPQLRALLGAPDPRALAEAAVREGWSAQTIAEAAAAGQKRRGGGRRRRHPLVRLLSRFVRSSAVDSVPPLSSTELEECRVLAGALARQLAALLTAAAFSACEKPVPPGPDADGDGYHARDDCDDDDAAIHPGAVDDCNGLDDDCSGEADDGAPGESVECFETAARTFIQERDDRHLDGYGASIAGDLDGDGRSDVLLGGPDWGWGHVHLFLTANLPHGEVPASTADWTLIGEYGDWASMSWGDGTGATLFPDLDGDGLDEVIVGAHGIEPSGGVYLVPGGNLAGAPAEAYLRDLASAVVEDTSGATTENGTAIGSVGDLDGDGRADLLVQAAYAAWAVPAEVLTSESPTLDAGTLIELPLTWKVGYRMASQPTRLGDIDGDGLDELAVNCGVCSDWGAIYIFSGQEDWTGGSLGAEDADIQILGDGGGLGDNMAGGADLDDDGLGDLAASVTVSYPEFEGVYLFRSVGAGATSIGPSDAELRIMPVEGDDSRQLGMALALTDGAAATDRALVVGDTTPAVAVCDFRASDLQVSGTLTTDSCGRRLVGRDQAALYGGGVLAGGDLNDDGRQDVVIADAGWDPDGVLAEFGAAFLILSRD